MLRRLLQRLVIQTYDTLDAAIEAAESGAEIEIGNDEGVITVNEIRKNLVINGNGHTITIPDQEKTDHRSLNIYASLTFNNTKVKFVNNLDDTNVWSATVNANSVLTLDQGSICTMENHGIYAENGAIINVKGQSKLTVKNTTYTALMQTKSLPISISKKVLKSLLIMHVMTMVFRTALTTSRLRL